MMMLNGTELKASIVLQAMVAGLLKSKNDTGFVVDMSSFGCVKNQLCYGCAATLTLTEMFGNGKSASEIMLSNVKAQADSLEVVPVYLSAFIQSEPSSTQDSLPIDLTQLEQAVDYARIGAVSSLIELLTGEFNNSFNHRWYLDSDNWEEKLPVVKATIAEMIAAGY